VHVRHTVVDAVAAPSQAASRPSWSPDGTHIVFSLAFPSRSSDIYTAEVDGTDLVQITNSPDVDDEFARWSALP
jgi:Tol biopolymer transport system component